MSDPAPTRARAMKAVLTDERFSDPDWIYERKLDGVRCVAIRDGDRVRLLSRNDLPMDDRYPEVADALAAQGSRRFAIDGEVVAFDHGQTSFARLARRGRERVAVFLYAFDITWVDGRDVRGLPLTERKRLLRETIDFGGPLRLSAHRREHGEEFFAECERGQELVVGGYTPPQGSRRVLGALLMGHFEDGELRYAGRVGTGFDGATLDELGERLSPLRRATSPFADARIPGVTRATWVEPELVAEIGFTEWTRHGRLRHPRFLGLRFDKPAAKVVREG